MKIKIIKDSVYEIENKVNDWLQNNDIDIKKIKSHYQNHTPYHIIMMIFYNNNYESDNTTVMNCKWCGKSKWEHSIF